VQSPVTQETGARFVFTLPLRPGAPPLELPGDKVLSDEKDQNPDR
jgi:hypothetical protein